MITLHHVSKRYGNVQALEDVSLDVPPGTRLAVVGPSGSGKTTLLRLVAGLDLPAEGTIGKAGQVISTPKKAQAPHLRGMAILFQRPALWPHLTVGGNARFVLSHLTRQEARRRITALADALHIRDLLDRRPDALSGGEARRAALLRALAPKARVLLLDEPLAHLDPELGRRATTLILEETKASGATLFVAGHDATPLTDLALATLRLDGGRVVGREAPGGVS